MTKDNKAITDDYGWYHGDCVELIDSVPDESVGHTIFSPPFPGMYAYTDSQRDMGNVTSISQMIEHFEYLACKDKLLRILMPGRICALHMCQLSAFKNRDGYMGIKDYRGALIQTMIHCGWIYYGEVLIDKNPQLQAIRNKEHALMFKSLATDSAMLRPCLPDYVLIFKKPGDNPVPIRAGNSVKYNNPDGWITEEEWIDWAQSVWYRYRKGFPGGIRETDVLTVKQARDADDERHLCPLQLGVIERCVKLWSAPGEVVFSPFGGIASEGYQAIRLGRKFIGFELKGSYWKVGKENLDMAVRERRDGNIDLVELMNEGSAS